VETLSRAAALNPQAALVMADPRMRGLARSNGLNLANEEVDLVVLLRDTRLTYPRLERAVNALANGAKLLVANPDMTHPGCDGRIKPETGALLAALKACVDLSKLDVEIVGKPGRHLFEMGCRGIGLEPDQVLMIGDNPDTDIAGAQALGMSTMQVGPTPSAFFGALVNTLRIA
jgi:4-nitrophenyl phosphatase